jgi:hypothetical protein
MAQFLVNGTWVELGALLSPAQVVEILEGPVIPSLQMFVQWEQEGRIHGGVFVGERETTFVLDASSAEEAGQLLSTLPFWGMMKWHVRPLQSFRSCVERETAGLERFRALPS